ncbi:type IV toxin-antitoxin system AbiEi family antitoxin [Geoalkalibacter halelectricus]|uniref:type IV toxin-antitoxin system AbiEi family antitoxin n=1 Tax=Geoalkalibacter halelectricus TaxID=2847045 RepID=UPI003D1EE33A
MANRKNNEQGIIDLCLASLHALPGCRHDFTAAPPGSDHAGHLALSGSWGDCRYRVQVVARLTPLAARLVIHQAQDTQEAPLLLLADFVSERLAGELRGHGIAFLDTVGNASLREGGLLVEVSGRKRKAPPVRTSRGFQPSGLRLIHLLLRKPEALNWNYRRLAKEAGLALGAVGPVLKELEERGFSREDTSGKRRLRNRLDLFRRWEVGYLERLRPKLLLERCRPATDLGLNALPEMIRRQNLQGQIQIGGELGAALILEGLKPRQAVLHLQGDPLAIMLRLRLVPDPEGEVILLAALGTRTEGERLALADPLLLHAELMDLGGAGEDPARQIFERFLDRHFQSAPQRQSPERPA